MTSEMHIRKAEKADLDSISAILEQGRVFLQQQGLTQWQNGYGPNRTMAERDIQRREGYVLAAGDEIKGYAALTEQKDESYTNITQGEWDTRYDLYISIHRVAVASAVRGKGFSAFLIQELIKTAGRMGYRDVRIDTHPMNTIMEKVILRAGFVYRGMVHLPMPDGARKAYQLLIDDRRDSLC